MGAMYPRCQRVYDQAPNPGEAELAELRLLNERFRGHHIFWEFTARLKVRYLAYAMSYSARPHTIITQDLAEIRRELEQANPQQLMVYGLGACY